MTLDDYTDAQKFTSNHQVETEHTETMSSQLSEPEAGRHSDPLSSQPNKPKQDF